MYCVGGIQKSNDNELQIQCRCLLGADVWDDCCVNPINYKGVITMIDHIVYFYMNNEQKKHCHGFRFQITHPTETDFFIQAASIITTRHPKLNPRQSALDNFGTFSLIASSSFFTSSSPSGGKQTANRYCRFFKDILQLTLQFVVSTSKSSLSA